MVQSADAAAGNPGATQINPLEAPAAKAHKLLGYFAAEAAKIQAELERYLPAGAITDLEHTAEADAEEAVQDAEHGDGTEHAV
jgi:hypothetical protein